MPEAINWLEIGRIVAAQGLKGEVRVLSYSDFPQRFQQPGKRWLSRSTPQQPEPIELISGRPLPSKSNVYIIRLAGIDNRTQAEALIGRLLLVETGDRPELEAGEYHVSDLIGCNVIHQPTGKCLGKITSVLDAGNDLLEVSGDRGKKVLIPFVEAIVPIVNLEAKLVEVSPPDGLIDELLD